MRYTCLNGRSAFQFGESVLTPSEFAKRAKALGYSAIGFTDPVSIMVAPKLFDACRAEGIHGVLGFEINIQHSLGTKRASLFIENEDGYSSACYLLSLQKNSLKIEELKGVTRGLTLVLAQETLMTGKDDERIIKDIADSFQHCYLGIDIQNPSDQLKAEAIREFASSHGYRTIAFPKVLYAGHRGALLVKVLKAAANHTSLSPDELTPEAERGPSFILSPEVLQRLYTKEEIEASDDLASSCTFDLFSRKRGGVLSFTGDGRSDDQEFLEKLNKAMETKGLKGKKEYEDRLSLETRTIISMGFSSYFLIVSDYVSQAKAMGISVGPGRGSAVGCLCAYLLNITAIDPLNYDLSFERFLNPKRVTMPDIDIDLQDDRRDEIVDYLKRKYGEKRISKIITFQSLQKKSALSTAFAAFGIPQVRTQRLIRSLTRGDKTLQQEYQVGTRFYQMAQDPYYKKAVEVAIQLEGLPSNTSFHPAGVIIADADIYHQVPLSAGVTGIAQYEYQYMERIGFLKVDLLSLKFLTFIKSIEEKIVESGGTIPDYQKVLNDPDTYKTICSLNLLGIFQLDSGDGIRRATAQIAPHCFADLVALLALYRPGPMGFIPLFASNKKSGHFKSTGYPQLDNILKETYGIIVYQEQILRIVHEVAGLDMGDADLLRRAISKKDETKMASYRQRFIQGCLSRNMSQKDAENIYSLIERFANYGFNKSHSVAYALLSFETAFLKTHFPAQFYLTLCASNPPSSPLFRKIVKEMSKFGLGLKSPAVEISAIDNTIANKNLVIGLKYIKSVSPALAQAIVEERSKKPFTGLGDFLLRVAHQTPLDARSIRALSQAGLLDGFHYYRQTIEGAADSLAEFAQLAVDESMLPALDDAKPNQLELTKEFVRELDAVGFSVRIDLKKLIPKSTPEMVTGVVLQSKLQGRITYAQIASRFGRSWLNLWTTEPLQPYDIISFKPVPPRNPHDSWWGENISIERPKEQ